VVAVGKGRHAVREPGGTFQKAEPDTNIDGIPWRNGGNVHETLRRLAARRGKREGTNDESKPVPGQYGTGTGTSAPGNP
jgi:hypothetical protein